MNTLTTIKIVSSVMLTVLATGCGNISSVKQSDYKRPFTYHDFDNPDKYQAKMEGNYTKKMLINKPKYSYVTQHKTKCPKLLLRNVDTPVISRNKEFLNGKFCDYYLYPTVKQKLSVITHGANLTSTLIMPVTKSLDNNYHVVEDNRRHVIRVEYNGVQKQPKDLSYKITVTLQDD